MTNKKLTNRELEEKLLKDFNHEIFAFRKYANQIIDAYSKANQESKKERAFDIFLEHSEKLENLFSNKQFFKILKETAFFKRFISELTSYESSIEFDEENAYFEA